MKKKEIERIASALKHAQLSINAIQEVMDEPSKKGSGEIYIVIDNARDDDYEKIFKLSGVQIKYQSNNHMKVREIVFITEKAFELLCLEMAYEILCRLINDYQLVFSRRHD